MYLTNWGNGAPEEDQMLVGILKQDFDLMVVHPMNCLPLLSSVEGIIVRNIWPTHEYQADWDDIKTHLRNTELPIYNPLTFKGDVEGKNYLVDLYNEGYPVIPSIDRLTDFGKLPATGQYWIKPKKSSDGVGAARLVREELFQRNPIGYIIQPFIKFDYEPSFFFVDNIFHHALQEKHRLTADRVMPYEATPADLDFARTFVRWTNIPYGTIRVDAVRTTDGNLLLTEIEDLCPYLYLQEIDSQTRHAFLTTLRVSLLKEFSRPKV
jgi:hypothetical protein